VVVDKADLEAVALALVPDERPPNENFEVDEAAGVVVVLLLALVLLPNAKPLLALLPAVTLVVAALVVDVLAGVDPKENFDAVGVAAVGVDVVAAALLAPPNENPDLGVLVAAVVLVGVAVVVLAVLVAPNENPDGFDAGVVAVVVGVEVVLLPPPPKLNPPVVGLAVVVVVEAAEAPVAAPPPKENDDFVVDVDVAGVLLPEPNEKEDAGFVPPPPAAGVPNEKEDLEAPVLPVVALLAPKENDIAN